MIKRIALIVVGVMFSLTLAAESLFVFVPTEVRANVMQEKIGSFCKDINITVFGRAKDFHKQIKKNPPNAILSLAPVIEHSSAFNPAVKGLRSGKDDEEYVLVSVDKPIEIGGIASKKIGVVDLLGRKPMSAFVEKLFKTKVKLKRVTKVEDLLPLITFGSVDAIFVSDSLFNQLKSKSNLNLVATNLDIKVGLVSAAMNGEEVKDKLKQCVTAFDNQLNSTLGVDQWRAL